MKMRLVWERINLESLRMGYKETLDNCYNNSLKNDEGLTQSVKMGNELDFIEF